MLAALLFLTLPANAEDAVDPPRPNVLFVASDDLTSCLDAPGVSTPNLDRLRERAVTFTHAYCQYPLCNPSRSSMLSGMRPDATGIYGNATPIREAVPDVVTLPQLFRRNGYFAARVGKIYHYGNPGDIGTDSLDDPESWDVVVNPAGRDKAEENLIVNYTPRRGLGSSLSVLEADGTDLEQTDGLVATGAIALMKQHLAERPGRPFFIAAGFFNPHCPYVAPRPHFAPYPLASIEVPTADSKPAGVPDAALRSVNPWPWYGATHEQARISKRAYYAAVSLVDAQVGRLLGALEANGVAEDTVVVFWSDHGYHLGEKGLWKKQSLFERSANAPLIIAAPNLAGAKATGRTCERVVEFVDVYPTLADLAGLNVPERVDGVSLIPLLGEPDAAWDRPAFTQVRRGRGEGKGSYRGESVRTDRWRYTEWAGGDRGVQLYDHAADPDEERNLADDPAHADTVAELRGMLRGRFDGGRRTGD